MTTNETKIRLGILSLVAIAILTLFIFDWRRIKSENAETAKLMALSSENEMKEQQLQAIRSIQSFASGEIEAFEALALNNDRLVPLIESLEEVGENLNLDLEIVSVEKKEDGKSQLIKIVLEATGDWAGVQSLLEAVESLPHRVMIENAIFTKVEGAWQETIILSLHSFN
jgi:ABC-type multidrug transport system fused ATPase/permease subunit